MMIRIVLLFVLGSALGAREVRAESLQLNQRAKLHARVSERARVLLTMKRGDQVTVVARKGQWLKVRARGRIGWVPRSKTEEVAAIADDGIDLDAIEMYSDSDEANAVEPEPTAEPVEIDEPIEPTESDGSAAVAEIHELPDEPRALDLRIGVGITIITQGLRSAGGALTVPDNYNIGVSAATMKLGSSYVRAVTPGVVIGGELTYAVQKALPGMRHTDPITGEAATTAFTIHDLGAKLIAGYDPSRTTGLTIVGRAGIRYNSFRVAKVRELATNPAMIPSELHISPTLGVGVAVPQLTSKIGIRVVLDAFFVGMVRQTKGLEDGVMARARGGNVAATLTYRWKPSIDIQAGYDLGCTWMSFGAPDPSSMRAHTGTSVTRLDTFHMLTIGIAKGY